MLVTVPPYAAGVLLAIHICDHLGVLAHPICVQPHIIVHIVAHVQLVDFLVEPINLLNMVHITRVWDWPIVREPCKLWGLHEGGDCDSVGLVQVKPQASQLHQVSEVAELLHDVVAAITSNKVVIASNYSHI